MLLCTQRFLGMEKREHNFRRDLTLHSAKLEIKRILRESFCLTASRVARDKPWSTLCKKSHGIPSSPRAAAVAKFRLLTGHDCLCAHMFRFSLVASPICVLCDTGQDMTAAHLDECSALNDLNCIAKSGTVTSHVDVVLPLLREAPNTVFQQDNARSHGELTVTAFVTIFWLAHSPDQNPIEHL
ncbi:uncharacterized protein TNCV_5070721 [Trichonephila clavipes]|nr:uncharacterized protein TNCV_5070721 [Trichonephila clavipes]